MDTVLYISLRSVGKNRSMKIQYISNTYLDFYGNWTMGSTLCMVCSFLLSFEILPNFIKFQFQLKQLCENILLFSVFSLLVFSEFINCCCWSVPLKMKRAAGAGRSKLGGTHWQDWNIIVLFIQICFSPSWPTSCLDPSPCWVWSTRTASSPSPPPSTSFSMST